MSDETILQALYSGAIVVAAIVGYVVGYLYGRSRHGGDTE